MKKQLRIYKIFFTVMILFTFTGCDDTVSAALDEEFDIGLNQKAVIKENDIEITFLKVLEDGRCPKGAECVWEGNGKVQILIKHNGSASEIKDLNTALEPQRVSAGDFVIKLLDMQPYPEVGDTINPEKYRIRLIVKKG
jgi:hypothetical protein